MFEKIVLRRSQHGQAFTAGEIAEALLFYQKVHIVLDFSTLSSLIKELGIDNLLRVLDSPGVSAVWFDDQPATMHVREGTIDCYAFASMTLAGDAEKRRLDTYAKRVEVALIRSGVARAAVQAHALKIANSMHSKTFASNFCIEGGIAKNVLQEILTDENLDRSANLIVQARAPQLMPKEGLRWEAMPAQEDRFHVLTNLSIPAAAQAGQSWPLTISDILAEIQSSFVDLVLAGHYSGDMYTTELSSGLITRRHQSLLRRTEIHREERENFSELVMDGRSLREVIDSGERTFSEFLVLLKASRKFRRWIGSIGDDEKLAREFFNSVTQSGWLSSLPAKATRFLTAGALGVASTPVGLAASAVDTFFLERWLGGWKPNQFVRDQLFPFAKSKKG